MCAVELQLYCALIACLTLAPCETEVIAYALRDAACKLAV